MKNLNLIVKADVQGSVEAVKQALEKLSNDEVQRAHPAQRGRRDHQGRREPGLRLRRDHHRLQHPPGRQRRARPLREEVDMRLYRVIYQAIEDIENAMKGMLAPEVPGSPAGPCRGAQHLQDHRRGHRGRLLRQDGKMQRNAQVRLLRDNIVVYDGKLNSLKRFKDDAKEVAAGYECGIGFDGYNDIKEGDIIECFIMEEIER